MYFNVAQLLKEPTGATRTYDLVEDLSDLDPDLEPLNPLVGTIQLLRTHSGILATGELSTALRITCNRCLGPIVIPVRFQIEENFRPLTEVSTGRYIHPNDFEGATEDLEDEALLINEQHILNIAEVVRQHIWLALPMYPTCDDAGLDECPNAELSQVAQPQQANEMTSTRTDAESADAIDPRWAALLDLKAKLDNQSVGDTEAFDGD